MDEPDPTIKAALDEIDRKKAEATKKAQQEARFQETIARMDAQKLPRFELRSRYHVVEKHSPALIASDQCTLDQLAHRMSCLFAGAGIYHADPACRMYLPRGTSMPSPLRYDFDRLRVESSDGKIPKPGEASMKDMAAVFASFLRQSKTESEQQLRQQGRFKNWWLGGLNALVACSDNATAFTPYLEQVLKEPLFEYTNGHHVKEPHVLPFDVIVRTGTRAVKAVRTLRAKGRTVTHYATILDLDHGGNHLLAQEGVTLHSMMRRRDLYCIWLEGLNPYINAKNRKMIDQFRAAPVQLSIDYAFKNRMSLADNYVPYRATSVDESLTCMLIRLAYENAALPYRVGESEEEFKQRRLQNYEKLHRTVKAFAPTASWWEGGHSPDGSPLGFIDAVAGDKDLNDQFLSDNIGIRAKANVPQMREKVLRDIEEHVHHTLRVRGQEWPPYTVIARVF